MPNEQDAIEVYVDLDLYGSKDSIRDFFDDLEGRLSDGWSRNAKEEPRVAVLSEARCFHCEQRPNRRAANLWFTEARDHRWSISNIVPDAEGKLSYAEYNTILIDFRRSFIDDYYQKYNLEIKETKPRVYLSDFLSPDVSKSFQVFSSAANKSTGSSHPLDNERWFQFLFLAYDSGDYKRLHSSLLNRFMIEAFGWHEEMAYELSIEYENYLRFLDKYLEYSGLWDHRSRCREY